MANKTDEVYMNMSRDYLEVISGNKVEGKMMQKWERQMRAEVAKIISDREAANLEADEAEEKAKLETLDEAHAEGAENNTTLQNQRDRPPHPSGAEADNEKMDVDEEVCPPFLGV